MTLPSYPDLSPIAGLYPAPESLLGRTIFWTEKRDGSQLRLALGDDGELLVATRHQDAASAQFRDYLGETGKMEALLTFLREHYGLVDLPDVASFDYRPVVFGELLVKGKSPARFEVHDSHDFVVFDIYDQVHEKWLPWPLVYQECYHYGLVCVECWGQSRHVDMESLLAFRDDMLVAAKAKGREGVVLKAFGDDSARQGRETIFCKEKLDTPHIGVTQMAPGNVPMPPLPYSELMGAVAKAHADLGADFRDKAKAMPLISTYVVEEQHKHHCGRPEKSLYKAYVEYLEGLNAPSVG